MSKIAYCPNCKSMEEYSNLTLKCKVCGSTVKGSYMNSSEWDTMSDSQKKEFLYNIESPKNEPEIKSEKTTEKKLDYVIMDRTPSTTSNIQTSDKELIKYVRKIYEDVHFIKTVLLIFIILCILGALITISQF